MIPKSRCSSRNRYKLKKPAISVLIPVYNNMNYIDQCLESIMKQSFADLEIIVINDGSTDARILPKLLHYAKLDSRMRVIDKTNSGYGDTLNIGICNAKGKYIGIIESDDFADKYMYEYLYDMTSTTPDIVKCGSVFFEGYLKVLSRHKATQSASPVSIFKEKDIYFNLTPINPNGIFLTEFIKCNNIYFSTTPGASFQDIGFHYLSGILAHEICLIPQCLYYYRRDNSDSSILSQEKENYVLYEYKRLHDYLDKHESLKKIYLSYLYLKKFRSYFFTLNRIRSEAKSDFLRRFKEEWLIGKENYAIDYTLFNDAELSWIKNNLTSP